MGCGSEQEALARLREQPSAEAAQKFSRDLQCEQLRPQVRRLLESLAEDPVAHCRQEADALNRLRTNPSRQDAERFAQDMSCKALKPQVERLLESLAE